MEHKDTYTLKELLELEVPYEEWVQALTTMINDRNIIVTEGGMIKWTSGMAAGAYVPGIGLHVESLIDEMIHSSVKNKIEKEREKLLNG